MKILIGPGWAMGCKRVDFPVGRNRSVVIEADYEHQTINISATGSITPEEIQTLKQAIDIAVMIATGELEANA